MHKLSDPNSWLSQYGDILYRHALFRLRDPMIAEETVQETFVAALQARQRFAGNASEKTWLIGILKHKIIDYLRKIIRERPHSEEEQALFVLQNETFDGSGHWKTDLQQWSAPENALQQEQFFNVLEMCVSKLPPRAATLFMLREIDGLDSGTICKEMDISSTNNLWVMLSRMRMRLRECLNIHWFGQKKD
ncbi:MAG: sigma-70 family RNA polymerase sigma factor [Gammaproteobacteria bacterium]|nr:sigma-70 family RNA polymerase sigma factor [Gammaproteobacteria bacterium]